MATVEGILNNIERFRSGYTTKRWEFTYADKSPVRKGIPYSIFYTKNKEEFYISIRNNAKEIIKKFYPTDNSMFKAYKDSKLSIKRESYLKPYQIVLTKKIKKQKTLTRYFAKYMYDRYDRIFEIKVQDFARKTAFYSKVAVDWQLQGSKDDILLKNTEALKEAENTLRGMANLLDPIEFYTEELIPSQILENSLNKLNEETRKRRETYQKLQQERERLESASARTERLERQRQARLSRARKDRMRSFLHNRDVQRRLTAASRYRKKQESGKRVNEALRKRRQSTQQRVANLRSGGTG